ncbi:MAG: DUF4974 domain-containing protein [Verrucomicrobia bacterium]|nr:DUF4974 domain-containing protein [Prolixibacteraceae bacterium]
MDQNIDFEIIWKKIHNQTSEEEDILLEKWLNERSSHRKYYQDAVRYYSEGSLLANSPEELKKALHTIYRKLRLHSNTKNIQIGILTGIAASILLFISLQYFTTEDTNSLVVKQYVQSIEPGGCKAVLILDDGTQHDLTSGENTSIDADGIQIVNKDNQLQYIDIEGQTSDIQYNTLKIPRGGEYFLILSDGTKVWLNSETTLRFPVHFAKDIRSVELTGEAFFEVSKDANTPFVVSSGNQRVKVLGTQFNVSSYPDDRSIYTTLVEGSVEVSLKNKINEKITLKPNEQSLVSDTEFEKMEVDVNLYVAWKAGRFMFRDQPLEVIMKTLSKWYDVQFVFNEEKCKDIRFTGNLDRTSDFNSILKKIERTNEVKFEIDDKLITVK